MQAASRIKKSQRNRFPLESLALFSIITITITILYIITILTNHTNNYYNHKFSGLKKHEFVIL